MIRPPTTGITERVEYYTSGRVYQLRLQNAILLSKRIPLSIEYIHPLNIFSLKIFIY
jgi:hypothetical protein